MSDARKAFVWMKRSRVRRSLPTLQERKRGSKAHSVLASTFDEFDERVDDSVVVERPRRHHDDEHENAQEQIFEQAVFDSGGFSGISFRHAVVSRRLDEMRGGLFAGL